MTLTEKLEQARRRYEKAKSVFDETNLRHHRACAELSAARAAVAGAEWDLMMATKPGLQDEIRGQMSNGKAEAKKLNQKQVS